MTALDDQVAQVMEQVDVDLLRDIIVGLVDIPSPTGEELPLATWAAEHLTASGVEARVQPLDDRQANAVGRVRGTGNGRSLLLYAPIDTLTTGNPEEDEPWAAERLRPDMLPVAQVDGHHVIGLGASNPKGHAACVMAATEAISRSEIGLAGDLLLGLGAGGMPTNRRATSGQSRENVGQGVGCSYLLEQGVYPDAAVIAKPGAAVAWEEVGLCWFDVTVRGTFSYVGSRHRMPYVNPIVEVGKVVAALEEWFPEYAARHTGGLVAPQGNIGSIRAGYPHMPAVSPASCVLRIDLRTSPDAPLNQVRREFGELMEQIRSRHPELDLDWDLVLAIPGTRTPQDSPVVTAAVGAWEAERGRTHEPITSNSGATDANILRARGVPTARIGMDRIGPDAPLALDFPAGMNVVDVREMRRLTSWLVRTTLNFDAESLA